MEMPFQVVITLFIVLVVGMLVILFAQDTLENSKQKIDNMGGGTDKTAENTLVEVQSINQKQIVDLAKQCYKENVGVSLGSKVCFVVESHELIALMDETIDDSITEISDDKIEIQTASNIKNFVVKWNGTLGRVEVIS